jgi:hypothetical protein
MVDLVVTVGMVVVVPLLMVAAMMTKPDVVDLDMFSLRTHINQQDIFLMNDSI